jgi:hypothetical protein
MTDILYLGVVALFFLVTWGLIRLCHRLANQKPEELS